MTYQGLRILALAFPYDAPLPPFKGGLGGMESFDFPPGKLTYLVLNYIMSVGIGACKSWGKELPLVSFFLLPSSFFQLRSSNFGLPYLPYTRPMLPDMILTEFRELSLPEKSTFPVVWL